MYDKAIKSQIFSSSIIVPFSPINPLTVLEGTLVYSLTKKDLINRAEGEKEEEEGGISGHVNNNRRVFINQLFSLRSTFLAFLFHSYPYAPLFHAAGHWQTRPHIYLH